MATRFPGDIDRTLYNVRVANASTAFNDLFREPTLPGERVLMSTLDRPPSSEELGEQCPSWAAQDWLDEYVVRENVALHDEFGQAQTFHEFFKFRGEVFGLFENPIDATLEMPLMSPEFVTAELIVSAQQEWLSEFPLWRLHICGNYRDSERGVMIYPKSVCVGDIECPPHDLKQTLADWRKTINSIRDRRLGPRRRQGKLAAKLTMRALEVDTSSELILLFACDNWQGDNMNWSAWYVDRSKHAYSPTGERDGSGDNFYLSADGSFTQDLTVVKAKTNIAELIQYTFPKPPDDVTNVDLHLRRRDTGVEIAFSFPRSIVLSDQQMVAGDTSKWEQRLGVPSK